jgi:hypothetical protein
MFACKHIGDAHSRRAGVILDVMNTPVGANLFAKRPVHPLHEYRLKYRLPG